MYIYLKNRNKEIVGQSIIDDDQYEKISKYKWCLNHGYAFNSSIGFLHRFLLNLTKEEKLTVDHINNNKLDNTILNLHLATKSEQCQNKKTPTKKTAIIQSKYLGVSWLKSSEKWVAQSGKYIIGRWINELHAAWAYDNYVKSNYTNPKHNNINKPCDFIEYVKHIKKNTDVGIYFVKDKWIAKANGKHIGLYKTKDEAIIKRKEYLDKLIVDIPIKLNINNIPFVEIIDRKNNIKYEMLYDIDDHKHINNKHISYINGYARIIIDKKQYLLHRLIMKANEGDIIDHINNNKLDNRKNNLRIVNHSINNQNVKKKEGCSSIYKGVSFIKTNNKWRSVIQINKKQIRIGIYNDEKEAALAYNLKAIELYGENCMLNII